MIIKDSIKYESTKDIPYLESFGVILKDGEFIVDDRKKLERAYDKAWENRDFEINKFWTRAAYFWGFLVLIFGAYFSNYDKSGEHNQYLSFYIICIGLIFSFAWTYVIRESKRWQENWEIHIDRLEDYVSGPLYKTINSKGKTFYSVSKINEILSQLIIIVWFTFLTEYLIKHFFIDKNLSFSDLRILVGLVLTFYFVYRIVYGNGRSSVSIKGKTSRRKLEEDTLDLNQNKEKSRVPNKVQNGNTP